MEQRVTDTSKMLWRGFDYTHIDVSEPSEAMEKFNPNAFKKAYTIYLQSHFTSRIIELDEKFQLPSNSILHILDDVYHPEDHSDTPRVEQCELITREAWSKYIHHVTDFDAISPVSIGDSYIYRQSGLPKELMKFRSRQGSNFRYLNELEPPLRKDALTVINYNPLFRVRFNGTLKYFRKIELILATVLNTCHRLSESGKQQYILIPWSAEIFDKARFLRTRKELTKSTMFAPESFHYIFMMHLVNYLWADNTTSLFNSLPLETLQQMNFVLQAGKKYLIFNMADIRGFNANNKVYVKFINQLNRLAIAGNEEEFTEEEISAVKDLEETEEIVDPETGVTAIASTTSADEEEVEQAIRIVETKVNESEKASIVNGFVPGTKASKNAIVDSAAANEPVGIYGEHQIKDGVKSTVLKESKLESEIVESNENTDDYFTTMMSNTDQFIDNNTELSPKARKYFKQLARAHEKLQLGGEPLSAIIKRQPASTLDLEKDKLSSEQLGIEMPEEALKSSINAYDKQYMETQFKRDLVSNLLAFQSKGVYLTGLEEKKTVTELNNYTTYTAKYTDIKGKTSTVKFTLPNPNREGRLVIDGITQTLRKQRINLPIVKINDLEVSLASNQNKTRVIRNIAKAHSFFSAVEKIIKKSEGKITVAYGSYKPTLKLPYEYTAIAERYIQITFTTGDSSKVELVFDYPNRVSMFHGTEEELYKLESECGVFIGKYGSNYLFLDENNFITATDTFNPVDNVPYTRLLNLIGSAIDETPTPITEWINLKILDKLLPVVFVLAYRQGLRRTLDDLGVKYTITANRSKRIVASSATESLVDFGFEDATSDYFFHITGNYLGPKVTLTPRNPGTVNFAENVSIPRISVADSVIACISAIGNKFMKFDKNKKLKRYAKIQVYAIPKKKVPPRALITNETLVKNNDVIDAFGTGEAWIVEPTEFKYCGAIEIDYFISYAVNVPVQRAIGKNSSTHMIIMVNNYRWVKGQDPTTNERYYDIKKHLTPRANVILTPDDISLTKESTWKNKLSHIARLESFEGFYYCLLDNPALNSDPYIMPGIDINGVKYTHVYRDLKHAVKYLDLNRKTRLHVYAVPKVDVNRSAIKEISGEYYIDTPYKFYYCGDATFQPDHKGYEWSKINPHPKVSDACVYYSAESINYTDTIAGGDDCQYRIRENEDEELSLEEYNELLDEIDDSSLVEILEDVEEFEDDIENVLDDLEDLPNGEELFGGLEAKNNFGLMKRLMTKMLTGHKRLFGLIAKLFKTDKNFKPRIYKISIYGTPVDKTHIKIEGILLRIVNTPRSQISRQFKKFNGKIIERRHSLFVGNIAQAIADSLGINFRNILFADFKSMERLSKSVLNVREAAASELSGFKGLATVYDALYEKMAAKRGITSLEALTDMTTENYVPQEGDIPIKFEDCVLWINRYPMKHSLITSGLANYDLHKYRLSEFESRDVYFDILQNAGLSINYLKGIDSFFDLFIDGMTFNVLKSMKMPTTVAGLLYKSAEMLATTEYKNPSARANHRLRGFEQFNAIVYNEMARQFAVYQAGRGAANTFSVNPEAIYLRVIQNQTMLPSEAVNPIQDLKDQAGMTYAGIGGRTSESFVIEDRKYSPDDVGVISEATVDNAKVGINAQLSFNPGITDTAGTLDSDDPNKLDPSQILSATGLLFPFATQDDSKRMNFVSIQSAHYVPVPQADRNRVRTGYERVMSHRVGRDFACIADKDGKVTSVDEKAKTIEVTYKDGTIDIFRYGHVYREIQSFEVDQDIVPVVKLGDTLKKGEVIAYNKGYFTFDPKARQLDMSTGIMANVALMELDTTLEDSTEISTRLSQKLALRPVHTRYVMINRKSLIYRTRKVGDRVQNTDDLMIFDEDPVDVDEQFKGDDETLAMLGDLNKRTPKAKHSGVIVDIDAYAGCATSEMSPTVAALFKSAVEAKNRRARISTSTLSEDDFCHSSIIPKGSKYKGYTFDENSVLICYRIQMDIPKDKGDKMVFCNQLKCTITGVFPKPVYTESGTEIDAYFSCSAICRRICVSPFLHGILARIMKKVEDDFVAIARGKK